MITIIELRRCRSIKLLMIKSCSKDIIDKENSLVKKNNNLDFYDKMLIIDNNCKISFVIFSQLSVKSRKIFIFFSFFLAKVLKNV